MSRSEGKPWTQLHVLPANDRAPYTPHDRKSRVRTKILTLFVIFLLILLLILIGIFFLSTKIAYNTPPTSIPRDQGEKSSSLVASSGKKTTIEEDCYGIATRFAIRKVQSFHQCSLRVSFESPYGSLIVDYRGNGGASVSSDILMRKANPEKYEETTSVGNNTTFLMFRNKESVNYEKTAFLQLKGLTIGITLQSDSSLNYDTDFQEILSSFYCKNGCQSATLDPL